ncbi:hypothetical protein N0V88_002154 [Collariella sp. IMI 366227]|nr:hypothetical protein N0V88_002154 [Collariella sp. IMI 366227]
MELHHSKHHQAYVTNLNAALQSLTTAISTSDINTQIALQQTIKFNGGGHINHSLFWKNLAPAGSEDADVAYLNGKATYVEKIWNVINWKTAEERFVGKAEEKVEMKREL